MRKEVILLSLDGTYFLLSSLLDRRMLTPFRMTALFFRIRLIRIYSEDKNTVKVEREGAREDWGVGEGEVEMGSGSDGEVEGDVVQE